MILPIVFYPDPRLTTPCEPVVKFNAKLRALIRDMFETLYKADGIGLAAPQVGVLKQVCIVDLSVGRQEFAKLVLVNPVILSGEGSVTGVEGCLSIPGEQFEVERNRTIHVKAQDVNGNFFEVRASMLRAVAIQHECQHLEGILIINRGKQRMLFS